MGCCLVSVFTVLLSPSPCREGLGEGRKEGLRVRRKEGLSKKKDEEGRKGWEKREVFEEEG
jgi:hypothetical protein